MSKAIVIFREPKLKPLPPSVVAYSATGQALRLPLETEGEQP